jgi:mRNA interferase MazF
MLKPFDVVVVPFPYSDKLAEKRRPALVVSASALCESLGRVWVAMITSTDAGQIGDATIHDLAAAGLPVRSTLRASKIATIDVDRVLRKAGHLSAKDALAARTVLKVCCGF